MEMQPQQSEERTTAYIERLHRLLSSVDELARYSEGTDESVPPIPEITSEIAQKLQTPEGKLVLETWLRAFKGSFALARSLDESNVANDRGQTESTMIHIFGILNNPANY